MYKKGGVFDHFFSLAHIFLPDHHTIPPFHPVSMIVVCVGYKTIGVPMTPLHGNMVIRWVEKLVSGKKVEMGQVDEGDSTP